jgi:hypothetical protein
MPTQARTGRKTIAEIQEFARANKLPVPDGYIASGEGGVHLGPHVRVIEVKVTHDPRRITQLDREGEAQEQLEVKLPSTRRGGIFGWVISGGKALLSMH